MDHFHYQDGVYHAEGVNLENLAQEIGTPFYCYSTATLKRHFNVFQEALSGHNAKICYAVKANSTLAVVRTLASLGAGADVVSGGEIRIALAAGVKPENIVFSGVGKTAEEMAFALKAGIFQFNVESEPELRRLSEVAVSLDTKAAIAVRVNPDVVADTHAKISTGHKESKFGISQAHALETYALAASLPGIRVQGVSVHIGSQLTSLTPFAQAFKAVRGFVEDLRAEGHTITTLDLGGGLGIPYGREDPPLPAAYAEVALKETKGLDCQLIFEPGRLLVGNAGILISRVIYVKREGSRLFVILDAGMNDLIRPTLYEAYHDIIPVTPHPGAPTEILDVVGPVCETGDIFAEQRLLKVPEAGDLIAIRSAGAYGASMASTYNARPLLAEVMVDGDGYVLARKRQTYEELLGRDGFPPP